MDQAFQNIKEWYREIAERTKGLWGEQEGMEWIHNFYDPWYGGVFGIQPEWELSLFQEKVTAARREIEAGSFPCKLMISEAQQALSPEQKQCLEEQGFHEEMWQTGMVLPISKQSYDQSLPEGDFIWLTEIKSQVDGWAEGVAQAFSQKEENAIVRCFANSRIMDLYYYLHNGIVAATGLVYHQKDVAGIYLVGTTPEFRRRGFADAIVHRALKYEAKKGVSLMVLQASEMGLPVYERIGFHATGRISHWEHSQAGNELKKGVCREYTEEEKRQTYRWIGNTLSFRR